MKKKITTTAITALMLISLISVFQAGAASAAEQPYQLAQVSDGIAEWTTEPAHSGSYSVKFHAEYWGPDAYALGIPVDILLNEITALSYWRNGVVYDYAPPAVLLCIDANGDGKLDFDTQDAIDVLMAWEKSSLLGDDAILGIEGDWTDIGWIEVDVLAKSWLWGGAWWFDKTGWSGWVTCPSLQEFTGFGPSDAGYPCPIDSTDHVMLAVIAGGNPDGDLYVDDITINDETYDLEMPSERPLTVDDDRVQCPDAYFQRIQSAIDAAEPGDNILVYPGTYEEDVTVDVERITIKGESVDAIVNGGFQLSADNITIDGLTIKNGGFGTKPRGIFTKVAEPGLTDGSKSHRIVNNDIIGPDDTTGYAINIVACAEEPVNIVVDNNKMHGWRIAIMLEGYNTIITNNELYNNSKSGIEVERSCNNEIKFNDIYNNGRWGIRICTTATTGNAINYNNIYGNTEYGVLNDSSNDIDATLNWWRDISGPYHSTNADGLGNPVSDKVLYNPWLDGTYDVGGPRTDVWIDKDLDGEFDLGEPCFTAIQPAIDAAEPGDTIEVAAGKYGSIIVNKSLTLRGAQAGVDARTRSGDESVESVIDHGSAYVVQIQADNVIFDGFTVTLPLFEGKADASGILTHTGGRKSNIRITNCIIHDIGAPTRTLVDFGSFAINSGPVDGLEIDHNRMYNIKHSDPTFAWNNAIIVWGTSPTVLASNINIHHNKMYDIEGLASPETCTKLFDGGIFISSDCENVTIDNNEFTNCGEYGISTNWDASISRGTGSAVTITNNVISGATVAGIRCMDKGDTITGNTISGCDTGVQVREEATATPTVQGNTFQNNAVQVRDNAGVLDILDVMTNNTFDRAVIVKTASCLPFIWSSIQNAIDNASPGDTVLVGPGTYEEVIKIMDKSLTLLGAQADVPIVNGERAGDESIIRGKVDWRERPTTYCLVRIQHSDVVINGFTIVNAEQWNIGIQGYPEAISNILIGYNYIEDSGKDGIFRANSVGDVTITHNYIASNSRGILTNGGATTITNNTFYGNGRGIDFMGGDPYSLYFPDYAEPNYPTVISGNTFTNDSTSITLRLDKCHQSITITGNDITEARSAAIETWKCYDVDLVNPAIHHNNIENNEFGINNQVAGINLDATYNYWGHPSGPGRNKGKGKGKGPGRGDRVSENVRYQPWLTKPFQTVLEKHVGHYGFKGAHLGKGWNTLSVPIYLDNNAWEEIATCLDENIAYRFDASKQAWELITAGSELDPLDAIYIRMNSEGIAPLAVSTSHRCPPVKELKRGWNLVGLAVWEEENMSVDRALVSVELTPDGNRGYTIVVSPLLNQEPWTYTIGQTKEQLMRKNEAYWVYMENPDNLAGFSSTPLPFWEPE